MTQYAVNIAGERFTELNDVEGSSTINPFGDRYVLEFLDSEGEKFNAIRTNQPVEISAREPTLSAEQKGGLALDIELDATFEPIGKRFIGEYETQFQGYIVEDRELQEDTRDKLEVFVYSFDQLIRNERVSNSQSGNTIFQALKNIIENDTPVTWNPANVSVADNRGISRSLQGLTVEDALAILARKSENEEYGVNDDREFFFRRREESAGERDITDADVVNWDIPERAKETKNEITVWYNNGNDRITISLGNEQIEVQDSLDTESPVPFPDEINRPEITDRQEALATGRKFLREREATLTGEVTVVGDFDYLNNEIGDTINVTITPRGIDDEFVIVSKDVSYLRDTVSFGIVEKRGDQDSLLREIGKQLKREELSNTDRQQKSDIVTQTTIRADLRQSYTGVSTGIDRVTTTCRNKLRDGWLGDETLEINEAILGQADSISRALTSIPNEQERISVSPSKNGSNSVDVDFDFSENGNVIGFEDTDGDLLFVSQFAETDEGALTVNIVLDATFESTGQTTNTEVASKGTFTLTIADDSDENSVLTNTGQEAIRDLFVGETSLVATQTAYGTNNAQPTESDSTLANSVTTLFAEQSVSSANTSTEWNNNTTIPDDKPFRVQNGQLQLLQSCFTIEGEDADNSQVTTLNAVLAGASGANPDGDGVAALLEGVGDFVEYNFTLDYDWPAEDWNVKVRYASDDGQIQLTTTLDNNTGTDVTGGTGNDLFWFDAFKPGENDATINAGSHTLRIELTNNPNNGDAFVDVLAPYDDRLSFNFDNTVTTTPNGDFLDGPGFFAADTLNIDTINLAQTVTDARLTSDFNDTSNGQFVKIGNGTTVTENNSDTASVDFSSPQTNINVEFGLDGFGSRSETTPLKNFNGQVVNNYEVFADLDVLNISAVGRADIETVFAASSVNNTTFGEAGQLNDNDTTLTRSIFPLVTPSNQDLIFSEDVGFDI